ncbi:MAG: DUF502 domain-containing protein [Deltaproteobacteria bacterium]|nr:DUF502 domain-containing protein [Deltaproteobacteria bacterium]
MNPPRPSLLRRAAATWLAGLLLLLPLALTAAVLTWLVGLLHSLLGPNSLAGWIFASLGYPFSANPGLAYVFGALVLFVAIGLLGLAARAGLQGPLQRLTDRSLRRIPLVGSVYNVAARFVGLLDQQPGADIGAMSPVWCFFGGPGGAAVLGLAPSPEPIAIDGKGYYGVLVPTAPVPFGGALLYVPVEWVRPADIGVDKLTAIYVSMGITPPPAPRPPR